MITRVESHRKAAVKYIFDNGNEVSIVFGWGTHSDNQYDVHTFADEPYRYESTTVEIMVFGDDSFVNWFKEKYDGNPGGCIPVSEIPTILQRADGRVTKRGQQ